MNKTILGLVVAVSTMGAMVARAEAKFGGPPAPRSAVSQRQSQPSPSSPSPSHQASVHQVPAQPPHQAPPAQPPHQAPAQPPSHPPRGSSPMGHYESRQVQTWVAAVTQRAWEPGRCMWSNGQERCLPGHFRTGVTPGHFETQTQWVWVVHAPRGVELAARGQVPQNHPPMPVGPRHGG